MKKVMRWGTCMLLLFFAVAFSPVFGQQAFAQTTLDASDIEDKVLTLEDDTVLNLDADLKLKSIVSDEYKLTIKGDKTLQVDNKDEQAIDVVKLKIAKELEITEPDDAEVKEGTVVDEDGEAVTKVIIKQKAEAKGGADADAADGDAQGEEASPEGEGDGDGEQADACEHELVEVPAKEATCTEDGNIQYWHCEKCGEYFADADATEQITQEDTVVKAKGHTFSHYTATPATCTAAGNIEYWHCTVCDKYFTDEGLANEVKKADVTIAALGHSLQHVKAKAATCTKGGNKEYWKCSRCGELFLDSKGEKPTKKVPTIAKLGHKWGKWEVVKEATTTAKGLERRVCKHNKKHVQKREIPIVIDYSFEKGANGSWTKGTKSGLEMIVKRNVEDEQTYDLFQSLSIDDKVVDYKNYSIAKGSLKLTLNQAYLEKLSEGSHKVKVSFEDGDANTTVTVKAKAKASNSKSSTNSKNSKNSKNGKTPKTGDQIPVVAIVVIVLVAAAALAGVFFARRRME